MLKERLQPFIDRYNEISSLLSSPDIINDIKKMTEISKEQSSLEPLYKTASRYINTINSIEENKELLSDAELGELAKEERSQ